MAFSWKFLLPLSLINLLAVALEVFFFRDSVGVLTTADLWLMAAINIPVALISIWLLGNLIREKVKPVRIRLAGNFVPGVPTVEVS